MLKVLLVADTHFKGKDFKQRYKLYDQILSSCKDVVTFVFHLGDVFDTANIGDAFMKTPDMVSALNKLILKHKIPHIMLGGNHDEFRGVWSINCLGNNLVYPITSPEILKFSNKRCLFVPWMGGRNDLKDKIKAAKVDYIFSHMDCVGANSNYFITEDEKHSLWCFSPNDFSCPVYAGHIHTPQKLGNVEYIGTIEQLRADEEGNLNRCLILDLDSGKTEQLETFGIKYHTVFSPEEAVKYINPNTVLICKGDFKVNPDHYARVIYKSIEKRETRKDTIKIDKSNTSAHELYFKYANLIGSKVDFNLSKLDQINQIISEHQKEMSGGISFYNSVELKNVGVFTCSKKVEFTSGINLILGRNGRGKTTLLESLYAGLYGGFPYEGRKAFATLLNGSEGLIRLHVRDNQEREHVITRSIWKTTSKGTFDSDNLILKTNLDAECEKYFGNKDVMSRVCFVDQCNKFDIIDVSETDRMTALRDVLGLSYFDKIDKFLSENIKSNGLKEIETIIKAREHQIATSQLVIASNMSKIKTLKEEIIQLKNNLNNLKINEAQASDRRLRSAVELVSKIDIVEYNKLQKLKEEYKDEIQLSRAKLDACKDYVCDNCGFDSGKSVQTLKNNLEYNKTKLNNVNQQIAKITFNNEYDFKIALKLVQEAGINNYVEFLYNNTSIDADKISKLQNEIDIKNKELGHCEGTISVLNNNILEFEDTIRFMTKGLEDGKQWTYLQEVFGKKGIPNMVVSESINEIQKIIDTLIDKSGIPIQLDLVTQKETKSGATETLLFFFNKKYDVSAASQGEKNLIKILWRLAISIYMQSQNNNYKVLLLDEPTSNIDKENTQAILELIKSMKSYFNQVIIVTHDELLGSYANNIIVL